MTAAGQLAALGAQALARFPDEQATVQLFLDQLALALANAELAGSDGAALLTRFEDYLEALLVRERWR